MIRTAFLGLGRDLPPRVVSNEDLALRIETSNEWIVERTGIEERRWVDEGNSGSQMAERACRMAVADAGIELDEVDCIILATLSPDHTFPGTGCFLQHRLGLSDVPALDVRNQCSGFIYGLSVADAWIRCGQYRRVLLVGCEVHSTGLDISTEGRDVAVLFGDAAAAVLLGPVEGEDEDRGLLSTHLHADGKYAKSLWIEAPGSCFHPQRITEEMVAAGRHFPKMKGRHVFTMAVQKMPEVIREGLTANGLTVDDLDLLVPHQANKRIIEKVAELLELKDEQVFINIEKYGNTTAASIPLALFDAQRQGRLKRGDLLALTSFGAGFTWASAIVRY